MTDEVPSSIATSGVTKRKAHRLYIDAQLQALVLFEELLERFLDGGAALQMTTVEIHVIAVLRPKRGDSFRGSFLKGINECLGVIKNGFFVSRRLIRSVSRQ
jgi:hypothetical protein